MLYSICLFALALLFYGGQAEECNPCPDGFVHLPTENKCYKVFPNPVTWDEAFKICSQLGTHLPVIKNPETNTALHNVFNPVRDSCQDGHKSPNFSFWSAGKYPCKSNPLFKWNTGNGNLLDIGYTNWRMGQPDNYLEIEGCIQIIDDGSNTYGWNDIHCHHKCCTICEMDI